MISMLDLLLLIGILLPRHALNTVKHSNHFPTGIQTMHAMGSHHFSDAFHSQPLTIIYISATVSTDLLTFSVLHHRAAVLKCSSVPAAVCIPFVLAD